MIMIDYLAGFEFLISLILFVFIFQLETKLIHVENNLSKEIEEKQRLLEECQLLKSQQPRNGGDSDSLATVEKLSEVSFYIY